MARDIYDDTISKLSDPVGQEFVWSFTDTAAGTALPSGFLEVALEETMKVPARVFKELFGDLIQTDLSPELGKIEAPALLIWGTNDAIVSLDDQQSLARGLPNAQLLVYEGAGHSPHWEQHDRFASDLAAFVQSLGPP